MTDQTPDTCSMLGAFNLRSGCTLATFKTAGYVSSHRLWKRAYHEGYDTRFPDADIVLEMCFHNHQASLDAWEYVGDHTEPLRTLQIAMNKQIKDMHFVLLHEVGPTVVEKGQK